MPNTLAEAIAFIKARGPFYLDGQCEKLVNNAGGFTHSYGLAILAMQASPVKLNPDYAAAPAGVIHYWTNVWGNWPGYGYCDAGHTMFGDGAGLLWGDSGAITTHYGLYAGSVTKADLEARKPWLKYAGWTPFHGPETLAGLQFASDGVTLLTNPTTTTEDTMPHPDGIVYKIIDGGLAGVKFITGPRLTVLPNDSVAGFFAGLMNHGLDKFPDYAAGGAGDGQPLPIAQANADWLAASYGPQIPGGTIASLWAQTQASGQPATYQPATTAPAPITVNAAPADLTPLEDRLTAIETTLTKGYTFAVKPS